MTTRRETILTALADLLRTIPVEPTAALLSDLLPKLQGLLI